MKSTLSKVAIFVAGAAIGSAVTWKIMYDRSEKIIEQEIEDFQKYMLEKVGNLMTADIVPNDKADGEEENNEDVKPMDDLKPQTSVDMTAYKKLIKRKGYTNYAAGEGAEENEEDDEDEMEDTDAPYVISPDEFGEMLGYETISLSYYEDKVLTDEDDNVIEDVGSTVGWESLDHFGEYEDDSVFVRNDKRKCDYEILLEPRKYSDVVKRAPHSAEV